MTFDFDQIIDRKKTGSLKWDIYTDSDVIPMWVADMDFEAPPAVIRRLHKRVDHGIFGYTVPTIEVETAVCDGIRRMHGWAVQPEWLVWLPGLVCALHTITATFSEPKQSIATFTPIYPPFLSAPPFVGRSVVTTPLVWKNGRPTMDPAALETTIAKNVGILLLCNPQNPTGRVFTKEELVAIHDVCKRHDVFVCSDEIHCDLVVDPKATHVPYSSISNELADNSLVLMAPSKTFNVAGLNCAFAIVPNTRIRKKLKRGIDESLPHVNVLGYEACAAAYAESESWHRELIAYLLKNRDYAVARINAMPGLKTIQGEATFLLWIDCRETGLNDPKTFFEEKGGVGLNDGIHFGAPGFLRLNFGCSRHLLKTALDRMETALNSA